MVILELIYDTQLRHSGRRTTAKAFAKHVFISPERKSEVHRRSDTVVVLTINDAD